MITPPLSTKSFYTVLIHEAAVEKVLGRLTNQDAISTVLVTSISYDSDIEATKACSNAVKKILELNSEPAEPKLEFNPMYLPSSEPDDSKIEFDEEGDITAVAGFHNPFIFSQVSAKSEEKGLLEAKVCYHQFALPPLKELYEFKPLELH